MVEGSIRGVKIEKGSCMNLKYEQELEYIKEFIDEHALPKVKKVQETKSGSLEVLGLTMKDIRDLAKRIGLNHGLSIELYQSNIFEYLMLATLIADYKMLDLNTTKKWVKKAQSTSIVDQALSSLLIHVSDRHKWIHLFLTDKDKDIRYGGFSMLSTYFRLEPLETLQVDLGKEVLNLIKENLNKEPITIQNAMNNAVVMAGLHVPELVDLAIEVAAHIGYIMPLVARNQCNIQSASDYIVRYSNQPKYSRVARLRSNSSYDEKIII